MSAELGRNFVLWLIGIPIVITLVNVVTKTPMPDADGWKRLAMLGVPALVAAAALDALADRWTMRGARAYGKGFAVALVLMVVGSADRPEGWWDAARVMKTIIIIIPAMASIMAVSFWGRDKYINEGGHNS